jgi:hypothetical protein
LLDDIYNINTLNEGKLERKGGLAAFDVVVPNSARRGN